MVQTYTGMSEETETFDVTQTGRMVFGGESITGQERRKGILLSRDKEKNTVQEKRFTCIRQVWKPLSQKKSTE